MTDKLDRLALKKKLGRTWSVFFERHGNFTPIQLVAIPPLLEGENAMICAPTASGKTEAVIVPLIESYCTPDIVDLTILYLTPTRALVNDLLGRLAFPLETLRISLATKTHDVTTFNPKQPASVLITTPESFDSLLTSQPQVFANLRALVIDEIHLFDGTARGDHLRVLLRRLREIRDYAASHEDAPNGDVQYVGLSATAPNPEQMVQRYFDNALIMRSDEKRPLEIELLPLAKDSAAELLSYLNSFRARGWKKALVFCNSRVEVESYAAAVRHKSPFGDAVYVHYSNIAPQRRQQIEERFATDEVALCFATNTLELGIDVGNIDSVILIGAPGNHGAFSQRVGRGNRRKRSQQVACFYCTPLEHLLFQAFNQEQMESTTSDSQSFRLSVVIQQIFSLIKQSPSGGIRLNTLSRLFAGLVNQADLETIVGHLQQIGYLKIGKPGEWRPDTKLDKLFDEQAQMNVALSIYSNIQSNNTSSVEIRDQHTHEVVANVDALWLSRSLLTLEGRALNVEWIDGEAIWVSTYQGVDIADQLQYRGTRKHLAWELAQLLPSQLGLEPHNAPVIAVADGWLCFHWLGDLYGYVLSRLVSYQMSVEQTKSGGLHLHLLDDVRTTNWSKWTIEQVQRFVMEHYRSLEPFLDLGAFHHLLPVPIQRQVVINHFDVPHFVSVVSALEVSPASDELAATLLNLLT